MLGLPLLWMRSTSKEDNNLKQVNVSLGLKDLHIRADARNNIRLQYILGFPVSELDISLYLAHVVKKGIETRFLAMRVHRHNVVLLEGGHKRKKMDKAKPHQAICYVH
ncbi:uncharacterized protein LOC143236871 isoform X2 [Tachypleus tridentatus]|uniref:uncharacterized protein LOC143236871 isoform X2 n=1 Tax=Tachypleus tridentatus TaxID=6853 RepID=UPI003FD53BC7